ncbi:hypothetical protein CDL15_Pgr012445 [Punica granatum]|uniref:Auxin-responsive protein n=1 Tax=Punica granatum TaxID=22663 RepID=A0A218WYM0_PUNGR|nr:hypothetical protein CDL15_Pgr012445 [Punica granatum]
MEGESGDGEACPQLELRLGPPGGVGGREDHWTLKNRAHTSKDCHESRPLVSSFGYFPTQTAPNQYSLGFPSTIPRPQHNRMPPSSKEPERLGEIEMNDSKGKAFSSIAAVPSSSLKRSFRKNLASTTTNQAKQPCPPPPTPPESQTTKKPASEKPAAFKNGSKGLFVKINMDGVPIGRKVDLRAYDSYKKLSAAVDDLFRGLLAAQRDSSAGGIQSKEEEEKPITGLLDGRGEYTLVYEDYEGDRMLVGDVPWQMFVSTVKRLRVLKSSELSVLSSKLANKFS